MSPTTQLVVSKRHIILIALAAFGGMIAAMLATLAITIPVMNAQASSLLDEQAKQYAQLMSAQAQTGKASQAAAFDFTPTDVCVEQEGDQGAMPGPSRGAAPAAVLAVTEHKQVEEKKPVAPKDKPVVHKPVKHVTKKHVTEKNVVNNYNNTYNDNDTYTVTNVSKVTKKIDVDVKVKSKDNKTEVNVPDRKDSRKKHETDKQDKPKDRQDHDKKQDRKDSRDEGKKDHQRETQRIDHKDKHKDQHDHNKQSKKEDRKDVSKMKADNKHGYQ